MKNYIQTGNMVTLTAPSDIISGDPVLVGSLFGIAATDALTGSEVEISTVGVFQMPVASAVDVSVGDKLYWDVADAELNKSASGNTYIGVAITSAGVGVSTVRCRLNGFVN